MTRLDPQTHSHLGWRKAAGFGFARRQVLVPLATDEIARVAQVAPVAFRKAEDRWQALAVLGPVGGANLYVSREGKWRAGFVPALLRTYPFRLDDAGELSLYQDCTPEPLAAKAVQPFYEGGALAPVPAQARRFLQAVHAGIDAAHPILARLEQAGALIPWDVPGIAALQPERVLAGLHALDVKRLHALDDAAVLPLFRVGALRWLHAHLDSLHHAERFRALAQGIAAVGFEAPRQADKIEQAADFLAAFAEDLGDAEL